MKNLILCSLLFISLQSSAQGFFESVFSRLSYGVRAGVNYSNFSQTNFSTENSMGFHAGVLMNFELTKRLSIQEDILFSTSGAKTKSNLFAKDELKLSYMAIPILLKYRSKMGLYAEAGPQVNMLLSDARNTGLGNFANKVDYGLSVGIGYQFEKGLGFGVRYYDGLSNVGQFTSTEIQSNFKNQVFQGSIFYIFK